MRRLTISTDNLTRGMTGMAEAKKQTDAHIARELTRRQNGDEADPNIDLSAYGVNENTDSTTALRAAAKLNDVTDTKNMTRNSYDIAADKAIEKIQNGSTPYDSQLESLAAPVYESQYDGTIKGLADDILNGKNFSFDINGDALYAGYSDAYRRNAKTAAEDAMGKAIAAAGGYGNSYAQAAANQSYNNQMQALSDKVPELYQLAYERYRDETADQYKQYNMLTDREDTAYAQYRDAYNDYLNEKKDLTDRAENYRNDLYKQVDMFNTLSETVFDREKYADDKDYQDAVAAADIGDFSILGQYLGIDTSEAEKWYNIQKGIKLYDATGMVDYLTNAGLDTTELKKKIKNEQFKNELAVAVTAFEATGDASYLTMLGLNTSYIKKIKEYQLLEAYKAANKVS